MEILGWKKIAFSPFLFAEETPSDTVLFLGFLNMLIGKGILAPYKVSNRSLRPNLWTLDSMGLLSTCGQFLTSTQPPSEPLLCLGFLWLQDVLRGLSFQLRT